MTMQETPIMDFSWNNDKLFPEMHEFKPVDEFLKSLFQFFSSFYFRHLFTTQRKYIGELK